MIDKEIAKTQAARFAGLDRYPSGAHGFNELRKALQAASSSAILVEFVDEWTRYKTACPKPAEVYAALFEANQKQAEIIATCSECEGAGVVIVQGVNRFDGLVVTGAKNCRCKDFGQPIIREDRDCKTCRGHGIYGGELFGRFAGPWKWCQCMAGEYRQSSEPEVVSQSNIAREKILRRAATKPPSAPTQFSLKQAGENYHGEF